MENAIKRGFETGYNLVSMNSSEIALGFTDLCIYHDIQSEADYSVNFSIPGIPSTETKKWVFGCFVIHPDDETHRYLKMDVYDSLEDLYNEFIKVVKGEKNVNFSVHDFFSTFDAYMSDVKHCQVWKQSKIQLKQEKHLLINDIRLNELFYCVNNIINANHRTQIDGFMTDYFCHKIEFADNYCVTPIFKDVDFSTIYTLKSIYGNEVVFGFKTFSSDSCNFAISGLPQPSGTPTVIFGLSNGNVDKRVALYRCIDDLYGNVIAILSGNIDLDFDDPVWDFIETFADYIERGGLEAELSELKYDTTKYTNNIKYWKNTNNIKYWEKFINLAYCEREIMHIKKEYLRLFAEYLDDIIMKEPFEYLEDYIYFCHTIRLP